MSATRYLAVCITLIAIFLSTLLHLAGYFLICSQRKDCLRAIYRIVKQRIISDHRRVSTGCRTLPGEMDADALKNEVQKQVVEERQRVWKQLLQDKLDSNGIKAFEEQLKTAGVKKYSRARFWILPEAIQPGLPSDFQAMLKELGFKPQEAQVAISLADQFDSLLITEGREAGKALTSALAEEDFMKLDRELSVEITLENFGDATYLLSPVEGISEDEIDCKPSQVRQVVSVKGLEFLV